jgi:hypothetical protein
MTVKTIAAMTINTVRGLLRTLVFIGRREKLAKFRPAGAMLDDQ